MAAPLDVVIRFIGNSASAVAAAKETDDAYSKLSRNMTKVGLAMTGAVTLPLLAAGKAAASELASAEKVGAQTAAVIKSTGGVANVTAKEVDNLATSIMNKSGIDDEAIKSGENLLLTFTHVRDEAGKGNDIFTQATKLSADLSVAWGIDMNQAAVKVGKALQDPIAGMTALSKVGVTFSADQKALIKDLVATGDVMGAQKVILKELETQVGGSAAAYGDTLPGQLAKARESLLNAGASIIAVAAPALNLLARGAQELAGFLNDLPGPLQLVVGGFLIFAAVSGPLLTIGANIKAVGSIALTAFNGIKTVLAGAKTEIAAFATEAGAAAIPLAAVVAAVAAVVAIGYALHTVLGGTLVDFKGAQEAGVAWGQSLVSQSSQISDLTAKHDQLKAALNEVRTTELHSIEDRVKQVAAEKELVAAKREVEAQQKAAKVAAEQEAVAMYALALSHQGVINATNSQIQSVQALNNAYLAAQGGEIGYTAAQLQVEQAQSRLDSLIAGGSLPTSLEYRQAVNDLSQAKLGAANAAFTLQSSEGSLANIVRTQGVPGLTSLRDTLLNTIRTHGDASGAVQIQVDKINDLIGRTQAYDGSHATGTIDAETDQATRDVDNFSRHADDAVRRRTAEIAVLVSNAVGPNGEILGYMAGGLVPGARNQASLAVLHGGELVIPASQVGSMGSSSGGGGVTYNQYEIDVTVAAGTPPALVGAAVVDQIRAYERANGSSWRQ